LEPSNSRDACFKITHKLRSPQRCSNAKIVNWKAFEYSPLDVLELVFFKVQPYNIVVCKVTKQNHGFSPKLRVNEH
jgi:hypothetical protein